METSNNRRRIYTLNGLPPEVIAVAFAKTSRSPEPFDKIAKELDEDKSRQFHEKWVVGYGHSSVAEHAVLSIAIENVSIRATKVIEDNRLSSYTEKSTRYQVFTKDRIYKPKNIMSSELKNTYLNAISVLFDTYDSLFEKLTVFMKKKYPNDNNLDEKRYNIFIKNKVLDNIRLVLPVSILTNLGMTVNARNLEYALVKLLSHNLEEMHEIAEEIKQAAIKIVPTLIKYVKKNSYIIETSKELEKKANEILSSIKDNSRKENYVELVEYDKDAIDKIITALLYRFSGKSYSAIREKIKNMPEKEKEQIFSIALKSLDRFDRPLRELENSYYAFDVVMDYGAYRDLQRHRMCMQTSQVFTPDLGFVLPEDIKAAGLESQYTKAMKTAEEAYYKLRKEFPYEAQYVLPMAFRKRTLFVMNLRELFHLIPLRSGKAGHFSYRDIAQKMYFELKKKQPLAAKFINVNLE